MRYLLGIFSELSRSRQSAFSPQPLPLTEIDAYARLAGVRLDWWEVRALRAMDTAWLRACQDAQPKAAKG